MRSSVPSHVLAIARRWLSVMVYRTPVLGDCTLGGITSRADQLWVPHDRGPDENPPIELRLVPGEKGGQLNFVPWVVVESGRWSMAGGNFVYCCDSRFGERYGRAPVSVHDRVEG